MYSSSHDEIRTETNQNPHLIDIWKEFNSRDHNAIALYLQFYQ